MINARPKVAQVNITESGDNVRAVVNGRRRTGVGRKKYKMKKEKKRRKKKKFFSRVKIS